MTEPSTAPPDPTAEDQLRQHAEPAVEGADQADQADRDQPREHAEDPAEG